MTTIATLAKILLGPAYRELDWDAIGGVELRVAPLRDGWLGAYDPDSHTIWLADDLPVDELLPTLLHELIHAQRRDAGVDGDCDAEGMVEEYSQDLTSSARVNRR